MFQAAVLPAAPNAKRRLVIGLVVMIVVVVVVFVKRDRCIRSRVRAVEMRHRYLFSHEMTDPCIAAIVTSRKALVARVTAERAGNPHE
jgi:hypothetical protein